ncbi:MAG TPA: NADH-quinone oxidoreductase subunit I, partial [Flavobacteriales bacterium]|nr:NADH-quinone oxidoreductase subunit I [Flavobacteriales bacterium]
MATPITQPLTKRSQVVSEKRMTLMERIYLPAIIKGMGITLKHFFRLRKATVKYPEQLRPM